MCMVCMAKSDIKRIMSHLISPCGQQTVCLLNMHSCMLGSRVQQYSCQGGQQWCLASPDRRLVGSTLPMHSGSCTYTPCNDRLCRSLNLCSFLVYSLDPLQQQQQDPTMLCTLPPTSTIRCTCCIPLPHLLLAAVACLYIPPSPCLTCSCTVWQQKQQQGKAAL